MKKSFKKTMFHGGIALCFLTLILSREVKLFAQDTLWTKTYGGIYNEVGRSIIEVSTGGFLIAGNTQSFGAGGEDIYLIRTNEIGDTLWTKTYGGSRNEIAYSVIEVSSGGFLITGYTNSYGAGSTDVYLIRTDLNGDTLWTRTFGGTLNDEGRSAVEISSNGYLIAGTTGSFAENGTDFWLIRVDSNGNILWAKSYDGGGDDICYSVCESLTDGFVVTGRTWRFGGSYSYVWLIKTDANGSVIWEQTYGEKGDFVGHDVIKCSSEGYIVVGTCWNKSGGSYDVYLMKTDDNGNLLWEKTYGGSKTENGFAITDVDTSGFMVVGQTVSFGSGQGDFYLLRTDVNGDTLWTRAYGSMGDDIGYSVTQCTSGGFAITGYTSLGIGSINIWLLRIDDIVHGIKKHLYNQVPRDYSLEQNYPNPFNPSTKIKFSIPRSGIVQIEIFNLLGKKVKILVNEYRSIGTYEVEFKADNLPSGVYLYRMISGKYRVTKKMILLK